MAAPISPVEYGGQPSQATMNLQGIRANRLLTQIQEAEANKRARIQAETQMAGQQSQERMATQQEEGVTQRNDAQIAESKLAREEDRLFTEKITKITNDNALERDDIQYNRSKAIADRDFEAAEKWRTRTMDFDKDTVRLQLAQSAMNMKMMMGVIRSQSGKLTSEVTTRNSINKILEASEANAAQYSTLKKSLLDSMPKPLASDVLDMTRINDPKYLKEPKVIAIDFQLTEQFAKFAPTVSIDLLRSSNGAKLNDAAKDWTFKDWAVANETILIAYDNLTEAMKKEAVGSKRYQSLENQRNKVNEYETSLRALESSKTPTDDMFKTLGSRILSFRWRASGEMGKIAESLQSTSPTQDSTEMDTLLDQYMREAGLDSLLALPGEGIQSPIIGPMQQYESR